MPEVNGIKVPFIPIVQTEDLSQRKIKEQASAFDSIFQQELEKVKFSNHAMKRLEARSIQLSENELNALQTAVEKAEQKGAVDSLVMMHDTAFIVNIPNRTVVTAIQVGDSNESVFTNIDSVVFT